MTPPQPEFREIYDVHFEFVWRCLRRLGVPERDVMDVTQKVFLTAHLKLPEFEGRSALRTWLFSICQRIASDYRRSAPVRREVATDVAELDLYSAVPEDLPSKTEIGQRASAAEALLNKLPESQRIVFVLFELDEMSGPEIADLLRVSVGTVRSRLRLARETFRREMRRRSAVSHRKEAV